MNIEFLNCLNHNRETEVERTNIRGHEPIQVIIYMDTPCTAILNKKMLFFLFFKNGEQGVKQVLSGDWYQWERGR
jgi:asparagine synthetase B (glutamine-hydrolysing)